jgi:hypothetical protein
MIQHFKLFCLFSVDQGSDLFCERIHACPETTESRKLSLQRVNADNTSCDFCINILTHVREILASDDTEREFKQVVVQACSHIGALKDEV